MGWEITTSWDDLQFVNYGPSEEFEDGRIAYWRTEDWEIYGPGGGGYTSPGPFSSVEGDLRAWINSGSLLAPDVLLWNSGNYSTSASRPNFGIYQSTPSSRRTAMDDLLKAGNLTKIDTYALLGSAVPFNGNTNPQIGHEGVHNGDIVVIGRMRHANMAESARYRVFDASSNSYTDLAQTYAFIDIERRRSDANVIRADYSRLGGPTPELEADFETVKSRLQTMIATLRSRPSGAYFEVSYTGPSGNRVTGRILLSELASWLELVDFEFFPATHLFASGGSGEVVYQNEMMMQRMDVTLQINVSRFTELAGTIEGSIYYLLHEILHASQFGQQMLRRFGSGDPLETRINTLAREVAQNLGVSSYPDAGGGYSTDPIISYIVPG